MKELKFLWLNLLYFMVYYEEETVNAVVAIGHRNKDVIVVRPEYHPVLDDVKVLVRQRIPDIDPKVLWGDGFVIDTWDRVIEKYDPSDEYDFDLRSDESIVLLMPKTRAARKWAEQSVALSEWQDKSRIAIEPRYVPAILEGIRTDGLTVKMVN